MPTDRIRDGKLKKKIKIAKKQAKMNEIMQKEEEDHKQEIIKIPEDDDDADIGG